MISLLAELDFTHPARLTALLILPILALVAYFYVRFETTWQRTASLACRMTVLFLLIAALAGPVLRQASPEKFVVFAVDRSESMSGSAQAEANRFIEAACSARSGGQFAILPFAGEPGSAASDLPSAETADAAALDPLESDPARAVLAAAASLPSNYVPEVVLLTDGRPTRGDLFAAAAHAGAPVSVAPLVPFDEAEVGVVGVFAPVEARPGESIPIRVVIDALGRNSGQVELWRGGEKLATKPLETAAGSNEVMFVAAVGQEKSRFEARLVGFQDQRAENNRGMAVVYPAKPIQVLVVDADSERAARLAAVLGSHALETELRHPNRLPKLAAEFVTHDVVILCGVNPKTVAPEQASALASYVRELGGGLIVAGAEETFGLESFQSSSLEELLPVAALARPEERTSSLALTLLIDRSDSMREENRLALAKEAAAQVVNLLTAQDKVGIIGFDSDSEWISEIYPCSDKPELLRRIARLQVGGQTDLYPPMAKAYLAMEQIDADRRHVILLTDANFAYPGDFEGIAARMSRAGITMSTVSISPGAEQTLLKDISRAARGRHYHCDNPADIPSVLVQETKSVAAGESAGFRPQVFRQLPGLEVSSAPPLKEAVAVSPKPRSELLLFGAEGNPLLTWWRNGSGVAMALAANVQQPWQGWKGHGAFWARLASHAARDSSPRGFSFALYRERSQGLAVLEALGSDGGFLNQAKPALSLTTPSGKQEQIEFVQTAPGRYSAEFAAEDLGLYEATAILADPLEQSRELYRATRALAYAYPDEFRAGPADQDLLQAAARVSGGAYNPPPESIFAPDGRTVPRERPLWLLCLMAATLALVADVAVRRYHELFGAGSAAYPSQPPSGNHVGRTNEAA